MARKSSHKRKTTPKAGAGEHPVKKKAAPSKGSAKAPKSGKTARKAAKPKAKAGRDVSEAVRKIVEAAGTPLTLDQLMEEHEARHKVKSRPSVKKAVVSLLERNELVVASAPPRTAGTDAEAAILGVLCVPARPHLTEEDIVGAIVGTPGNEAISRFAIHLALGNMSDPNIGTIRESGGEYWCP